MSKASEITICHANEIREVNKTSISPLEAYSPQSPCIINHGLKSQNEMRDHSIFIIFYTPAIINTYKEL